MYTGNVEYGGYPDPFDRVGLSPDPHDVSYVVMCGVTDLRAGEDSTCSGHDFVSSPIAEVDVGECSGVSYGWVARGCDAACLSGMIPAICSLAYADPGVRGKGHSADLSGGPSIDLESLCILYAKLVEMINLIR